MKKIDVEIMGDTPLLMNSPKAMLEEEPAVKSAKKKYDRKEEAEKVAYRNKDGKLFVPVTAVKGCIINAAAYMKAGKHALRPLIAGGTRIEPFEISILDLKGKEIKDYEIDARTVVIQRQRVVKARPLIRDWKLKFRIIYNEQLIPDVDAIRKILEDAGQRVGLLDFAPRNKGEFGCFSVTKFMPEK